MKDRRNALNSPVNGLPMADVAFDERDFIKNLRQVFTFSRRKVIEDNDIMSFVENVSGEIRTDKSGTAGNQIILY